METSKPQPEYLYQELTHTIIGAGEFKADFIVDGKVVVEIKAISTLTKADEAQIINYLKATGLCVGLLINFGKESLEFRRFAL